MKIVILKLFHLILCCLPLSILSQTVIIAVKKKDTLYVGADSRTLRQHFINGRIDSSLGTMCKIVSYKNYYIAVAGSSGEIAIEEFNRVAPLSKSFNDLMIQVARPFMSRLLDSLKKMANTDWLLFNKYISGKTNSISQFIFFGKESDTLFLGHGRFQLTISPNKNLTLNYFTDQTQKFIGIGNVTEIKQKIISENTWKGNIAETISSFIKIQTKKYPYNVGLPIDLIRVSREDIQWLKKKSKCN